MCVIQLQLTMNQKSKYVLLENYIIEVKWFDVLVGSIQQ